MNNTQKKILLFRAINDIHEFQVSLKDVALKTTDMYHSIGIINEFDGVKSNYVNISINTIEEIERLQRIIEVIKDTLEGIERS